MFARHGTTTSRLPAPIRFRCVIFVLGCGAAATAGKLEIAYVRAPPAAEPVMPVATAPDETPPQPLSPPATPKIVSRHSHDPHAKKVAAVSPGRRIKGQESKKIKNVERAKLPVYLRPCPRPEGFAGLLRVLNLSPGCDS